MNKLYKCQYINELRQLVHKTEKIHSGYDCWKFIKYKPDSHIKKIYNKIISNKMKGKHILLNIRDDQRILYENTDFTITPQHLGVIVREQNITRKKNN